MHVRVRVKVRAGAKKESFTKTGENEFTVSVREPAQRNQANVRIRELLAGHYRVPMGKVRIITGHRSPSKTISIGK